MREHQLRLLLGGAGQHHQDLPVPPATCDTLCEVDDNCEFWKARIDGTLCQLLLTDYQHVSSSCFFLSTKSIRKKT